MKKKQNKSEKSLINYKKHFHLTKKVSFKKSNFKKNKF